MTYIIFIIISSCPFKSNNTYLIPLHRAFPAPRRVNDLKTSKFTEFVLQVERSRRV